MNGVVITMGRGMPLCTIGTQSYERYMPTYQQSVGTNLCHHTTACHTRTCCVRACVPACP